MQRVGLESADGLTRMRRSLRDLVLFVAAHPELYRFMIQEGSGGSGRLEWLVDKHLRPGFMFMDQELNELESVGAKPVGLPAHLRYMTIGAAVLPYAASAEFERVTGEDPFSKEMIEAHIEALLALFLPEPRDEASYTRGATCAFPGEPALGESTTTVGRT